jgi:hypothetical protein
MADTQKLRDLADSYRVRSSKGESDLVARYNLDMATYLDSIAATVEAAAYPGEAEYLRQALEPEH